MARPTNAQLATENANLRRRIKVALELHHPVAAATYTVRTSAGATAAGEFGVMCAVCRDPYPCDTALALGTPQ
jgi:hypothetical protein